MNKKIISKNKKRSIVLALLLNTLVMTDAWAAQYGYQAADGNTHTVGDGELLQGTYRGVEVKNDSTLNIGNNADIQGGTAGAVYINNSELNIGDRAKISSNNSTGTAIYADGAAVVTIGSNAEIVTANYGYALNIVNGSKISIGDNAQLTSGKAIAVSAYKGAEVTIGDGAVIKGADGYYYGIESKGSYGDPLSGSTVKVGHGSTITGGTGITAYTYSRVLVGDDAVITGTTGDGISASMNGQIIIGSNARVAGDWAVVASSAGSIQIGAGAGETVKSITGETVAVYASGGEVTIGSGGVIKATNSSGSYGLYGTAGGKITVGADSEITAGENAVFATGSDTEISVGAGAKLTAAEHAVFVKEGGVVNLDGLAAVDLADADTYYVLYATGADSKINGDGKFTFAGNWYAGDDAEIDLKLQSGSVVQGSSTEAGGRVDMTLMEGAQWQVNGVSSVTNMVNNGIVDLTGDNKSFNTLTLGSLSGAGGIFVLDIDGTDVNLSDKMVVSGDFSGSQALKLLEVNGRENEQTLGKDAEGTVLVTVQGNNGGVFTAVDGEGTLYWQRYELDQQANSINSDHTDWYLKSVTMKEGTTTSVNAIVAAGSLGYHTWRSDGQLQQRLGELRSQGAEGQGAWVRVKGSKISRNGSFGFVNNYREYELGYDKIISRSENSLLYGGVAVSYADGKSGYDSGSGDNKNTGLKFYTTRIGTKGQYFDIVLKVDRLDNDFKVWDSNGKKISGAYGANGVSLSVEYGYKKPFSGRGFYLEPQAQLMAGYLSGADYTTSNGIRVAQDSMTSVLGRIGFKLGQEVSSKADVYLRADLLHEFGGSQKIKMTDSSGFTKTSDRDYDDTWFEYGVGAAVKLSDHNQLYFNALRSYGGNFKKDWQWNVGLRWTF